MTHTHGNKSVRAAFIGNIFVTFSKIVAAVLSGSTSMFAESVHSFADTLNQSFLLIGIRRSKRPADDSRGYGYGSERFFWSLISACGVLFIGAGITIFRSIDSLFSHAPDSVHEFNKFSIGVLLIAFIVEGFTLYVAVRELRGGARKLTRKHFTDADPITLAVVYEDGAAVLGIIIALVAQLLTYMTGMHVYDAIGGLVVGIILGVLAVFLIVKNYPYIIGKPLSQDIQEEVIDLLSQDPCVEKVVDFKSEAIDMGVYRIFITIEWNGAPLYKRIYHEGELQEEFDYIKDDFGEFAKLMLSTVDRVPRLVGHHIDVIEKKIKEEFPQIAYIDIEIN